MWDVAPLAGMDSILEIEIPLTQPVQRLSLYEDYLGTVLLKVHLLDADLRDFTSLCIITAYASTSEVSVLYLKLGRRQPASSGGEPCSICLACSLITFVIFVSLAHLGFWNAR